MTFITYRPVQKARTGSNADWETSLMVRNVTDERAGTIGFDLATLCGCNEVAYREPRWYGVSVRYNF